MQRTGRASGDVIDLTLAADEFEPRSFPVLLEDQLEVDLRELGSHPASKRRGGVSGLLWLIALIVGGLGVLLAVRVAGTHGLGVALVGLVGVWVLPMIVLAVVVVVEKLLLRITH
jgi:hypothetical protein